jgi:hypothetical protein
MERFMKLALEILYAIAFVLAFLVTVFRRRQ